jgi:hypothetical protein
VNEARSEALRDRLVRLKAPKSAWSRPTRTTLRTLHLLGMACFFGAAAFDLTGTQLALSVHLALVTGLVFAGFEIWRAPVWLVQVRGVVKILKGALLAAALFWPAGRLFLAILLVAIGSTISHAPAKLRYHSVLHGHAIESGGRG